MSLVTFIIIIIIIILITTNTITTTTILIIMMIIPTLFNVYIGQTIIDQTNREMEDYQKVYFIKTVYNNKVLVITNISLLTIDNMLG